MAHIDTEELDRIAKSVWAGNGAPLTKLGAGAFRVVYKLTEDTVVKFDHYANDYRGCNEEARVWEAAKGTEFEQFLAPVLASGDGWLVMPYIRQFWDNRPDLTEQVNKVRHYISAELGIWDLHGGNIGIVNEKPVVTDYADERALERFALARKTIATIADGLASDADEDDILDAAEALAIWRRGAI